MPLAPLTYESHRLVILDQTRLPQEAAQIELHDLGAVVEAIRCLRVRGAPLIGTAAAFGVCVALRGCGSLAEARARAPSAFAALRGSRPTAVNLFWALERMERALAAAPESGWFATVEGAALALQREVEAQDAALIEQGLALLAPGARVITHCNTGPLATGALGTALGVLIAGHRRLGGLHVYADETRPRWQGALLTTWELANHGVPHTLIADGAAAALMRRGGIHSVWVGADRIAANGDSANKIGTYGLALAARAHGIPFYVAAPTSTVDLSLPDGAGIPIEERDPGEVAAPRGVPMAPPGTAVWNPAFDVTPAPLISAIVTEIGVHRPVQPGGPYDLRRDLQGPPS